MRRADGMLRLLVRETVMRSLSEDDAPGTPEAVGPVRTTADFRKAAALGEGPVGEVVGRVNAHYYKVRKTPQGKLDFLGFERSDGTNSRAGQGAPFPLTGRLEQDFYWGCTGAQGSDTVTAILFGNNAMRLIYGLKMTKGSASVTAVDEDTGKTLYTATHDSSVGDVVLESPEFRIESIDGRGHSIRLRFDLTGAPEDAVMAGMILTREVREGRA